MSVFNLSNAVSVSTELQTKNNQQQMAALFKICKENTSIKQSALPVPYDYLLTQPLMTLGIEKYYKRTPIIQTIYATKHQQNNTYSRAIIMLVDHKKERDNAGIAQVKKEADIVELAFITMNFNELPPKVITGVLNTDVPFGKLLASNHIAISNKDRTYFSVNCSKTFATLIRCNLNSKLYGRTHTMIRVDNKKWIARVIEILPIANVE